ALDERFGMRCVSAFVGRKIQHLQFLSKSGKIGIGAHQRSVHAHRQRSSIAVAIAEPVIAFDRGCGLGFCFVGRDRFHKQAQALQVCLCLYYPSLLSKGIQDFSPIHRGNQQPGLTSGSFLEQCFDSLPIFALLQKADDSICVQNVMFQSASSRLSHLRRSSATISSKREPAYLPQSASRVLWASASIRSPLPCFSKKTRTPGFSPNSSRSLMGITSCPFELITVECAMIFLPPGKNQCTPGKYFDSSPRGFGNPNVLN